MIESLFNTSTIPLLAKAAAFAERRHEVLAGNVANISTPDYRTRDLPVAEFRAALEEAIARKRPLDSSGKPAWSFSAGSFSAGSGPAGAGESFPQTLLEALEAPPKTITFQDGNNRSIEKEVMEITKNSIMQTVAIELMNVQLNRLQAVISERA
jgi:flagellar basal-body rod protein FlgB